MTDESKAIEEVAKLGQRSLETAEKAGAWTDTVIGEAFRELGGAFHDTVIGFRVRNRLRVFEKTDKAIKESGLKGTFKFIDDRLALPLIEAVSDEDDPDLQDMWAKYIRNALDPSCPQADRLIIDVIRKLDPSDLSVLEILFASGVEILELKDFKVDQHQLEATMDRLSDLALFDHDSPDSAYIVAEHHMQNTINVRVGTSTYWERRLFRRLVKSVHGQSVRSKNVISYLAANEDIRC